MVVRRWLGQALLVVAVVLSLPWLPRALAYLSGTVALPAASPARYRTVTAAGTKFLSCTVPQAIVVRRNRDAPAANQFSCSNNFGTDLTLEWSVVDDGGGGFLSIPVGSSTALAAGSAGCRSLVLSAGNTTGTRTVTFRGATTASAGLYAEIYFTGSVTIQSNTTGLQNGCP